MADEDEQQEPQEESEITDQREIDARRERLFEGFEEEPEESEQPQEQPPPSRGIAEPPLTSEEAARGLEAIAPGLGSYMNRLVGDFMASNRREDQMRPPKPPVKIETDWQSFPDVKFRREEPEEEPPVIVLGACCNGTTCSMKTRGDCESGGGTFQGEGTSCSTSPCGNMGACCIVNNCSIKTQTDCVNAGGTYLGDGTSCSPNPCGKICPSISLSCDSITATKSKCGFPAFDGSPHTYLNKDVETTYSGGITRDFGTTPCDVVPCSFNDNDSGSASHKYAFDQNTCAQVDLGCSGTTTITQTAVGNPNCPTPPNCSSQNCMGTCSSCPSLETGQNFDCGGCPTNIGRNSSSSSTQTTSTQTLTTPADIPGSWTWQQVATLSNEYTNDQLLQAVIAALPPYCGFMGCGPPNCPQAGQGCECEARYELNASQTQLTLERFKYKFMFGSPVCAGMILRWDETFTPDGGGGPTFTPMQWISSGGETETPVFGPPADPTENGVTTITGIVGDCSHCP